MERCYYLVERTESIGGGLFRTYFFCDARGRWIPQSKCDVCGWNRDKGRGKREGESAGNKGPLLHTTTKMNSTPKLPKLPIMDYPKFLEGEI